MTRREQAARAREVLLDAGAEELWLHGLEGAKIQAIMDRASTTKGGLYHYFDGKYALARALAEEEAAAWPAMVEGALGSRARGLEALRLLCEATVDRLESRVRARAVLRIVDELDPAVVTSVFTLWHDAVIRCLLQAVADREVSDAIEIREVAWTVVEAVYGVVAIPSVGRRGSTSAGHRLAELWSVLDPGLRTLT